MKIEVRVRVRVREIKGNKVMEINHFNNAEMKYVIYPSYEMLKCL